jgi:predicted PurR-regulated permease PerM
VFPRDPNEPRFITWLRNPSVRRTLILGGLWAFVGLVLVWFRAVLLPFGLAVLLAFILEPVVENATTRTVRGRPVPRVAAILSIYAVVAVFLYLFGSWTLPQIGREMAKVGGEISTLFGSAQRYMLGALDRAEAFAVAHEIPLDRAQIETLMRDNLQSTSAAVRGNAAKVLTLGRDVVASLVGVVFGSFLVLMLTAFISLDKARITAFAASMVPPENRGSYDRILRGITVGLGGVVRGQVTICLTNGVLTFLGLWLLGVKFPFLLAAVAAVFSLIPIFGSIISTLPIVSIALTQSFALGVLSLLWIIGIHLLEANFLNPKIMGDAAKIHPVIVVFVLIVGEKTSGLIGALFAVPIASVVLTIFKFLHDRALSDVSELGPRAEGDG